MPNYLPPRPPFGDKNFVQPYSRTGGGLPPTPSPYPLLARIGDWLNLPEVVIVRGVHSRRWLYTLLRYRGIRVRSVGYQAAVNSSWWQFWQQDTYVRVERHYGGDAAEILRSEGFEIVNGY